MLMHNAHNASSNLTSNSSQASHSLAETILPALVPFWLLVLLPLWVFLSVGLTIIRPVRIPHPDIRRLREHFNVIRRNQRPHHSRRDRQTQQPTWWRAGQRSSSQPTRPGSSTAQRRPNPLSLPRGVAGPSQLRSAVTDPVRQTSTRQRPASRSSLEAPAAAHMPPAAFSEYSSITPPPPYSGPQTATTPPPTPLQEQQNHHPRDPPTYQESARQQQAFDLSGVGTGFGNDSPTLSKAPSDLSSSLGSLGTSSSSSSSDPVILAT